MESTSMNRRCTRNSSRLLAVLLIERKHAHVHAVKRNNNHTANRFAICESAEKNRIDVFNATVHLIPDHRCEYVCCGPDTEKVRH